MNEKIFKEKIEKNILYYHKNTENKMDTCDQIVDSWENSVNYIIENFSKQQKGLRKAQLGAVFAIRAHWTVSNKTATIVMPTGTGKTETMITTIVAEQLKKVFLLVPSDLLRKQTVEVCAKLGILKEINVINQEAKFPNVLLLKSTPKTEEELKKDLDQANIIVSTASLISRFSIEYMNLINDICQVLIVDEAHHIEAECWKKIKTHFKEKKILQFTATPFRNDGKKIDGDIIFNFPLSKAQEQGYFQKINFKPIIEYDDETSDEMIASAAIKQLEEDLSNKYNHLVLVRAKTVERAKKLYNDIYLKQFRKYNPVLILGEINKKDKEERLSLLKNQESKIVVCVDMFGEGIDIPNLKIAAIHDKYKSLPITLQFIGRFARNKSGLGNATIIANIANEDMQDALTELYSQDSDWNYLLSELSNESIGKEISLQKLANGFKGNGIDSVNIKQLRPSISMIAFKTESKKWHWKNWTKIFNEDLCKYYINDEEKILIIIEPENTQIEWANYKEVNNLNWNLHIVYWNEKKNVLFANSTNKSILNEFTMSLFNDKVKRIQGEDVFKCLHGFNRLVLANVGLNSAIDGPIRYRMFTGIDIKDALTESQKGNTYKSNIFGRGYNGNGKASIGCSYKGTIWSRLIGSIDEWKNWCNSIYEKICDPNIKTEDILKGVLKPVIIKERPKVYPYRIDWPNDLDICCDKGIYIEIKDKIIPIFDLDIKLINMSEDKNIQFYVGNEDFKSEFELIINENNWTISEIETQNINFCKKNIKKTLVNFFNDNPPEIKFVDQSSLQGNIYVTLENKNNFKFNKEQTIPWEWNNVDIKKESQGTTKEKDSIQYYVIQKLLKENYEIIFDDDNAGEIADIVTIKEKDNEINFEFYHCKYAHGEKPGSRLADLYEVCGQVEKSVLWKNNVIDILERMKLREKKRLENKSVSRFEKGDLKKIERLKRKLKFVKATLKIYIVQPGVSASKITPEMHQLLCGTQAYLLDTYGITLKLICSQ